MPSEAEWEYAARGPDSLIFPWGNAFDGSMLNFCDLNCSADSVHWADMRHDDGYWNTAPVGSYPEGASWVGALDMSGNVWEWVSSMMHEYPYRQDDGREVDGKSDSSSLRALRGGSFQGQRAAMRAANRNEREPIDRSYRFGFRCVR